MTKTTWLDGIMWVVVGVILDFSIQILGVFGSRGFASIFGQSQNGWFAMILLILIVAGLTFAIAKLLIQVVRRADPELSWHPIQWSKLSYIFIGYVCIIFGILSVNFVRVLALGHVTVAENQQTLQQTVDQGLYGILFVGILSIFVAPIVEELIFRGIVMNYFFKHAGWWWNVLLSAGLFGLFHVYRAFNPFDFLQYAIMGGVLAYVYKKTGQLQYAMLTHGLNNLISFLVMLAIL